MPGSADQTNCEQFSGKPRQIPRKQTLRASEDVGNDTETATHTAVVKLAQPEGYSPAEIRVLGSCRP